MLCAIKGRKDLPHLLNILFLTNEGAEVGTQQAKFSSYILTHWKGRKLYSIDPWLHFDNYNDISNVPQYRQEQIYADAINNLKQFGNRSQIMRCTSLEASKQFQDGQLDFVYLDAQHHYEAVKQDINLWYPKVKPGGILSGHDYVDGQLREGTFGVKSAVDEFTKDNNLTLIISQEPYWPSWFITKRRSDNA